MKNKMINLKTKKNATNKEMNALIKLIKVDGKKTRAELVAKLSTLEVKEVALVEEITTAGNDKMVAYLNEVAFNDLISTKKASDFNGNSYYWFNDLARRDAKMWAVKEGDNFAVYCKVSCKQSTSYKLTEANHILKSKLNKYLVA